MRYARNFTTRKSLLQRQTHLRESALCGVNLGCLFLLSFHMPGNAFHEKAGLSQDSFCFFLSVDHYFLAEPPLSPSFHPQSLLSDGRSLPGGRPRYSSAAT
jgi:hypothetical protein